jgi:hypothetical protein
MLGLLGCSLIDGFFWVIPLVSIFRCWGITQKKAYNIHNMAKV